MQGSAQEKKKMCFNPTNAQDFEKLSPNTSQTVNGLCQHKFPDVRDRGSTYIHTTNRQQNTSLENNAVPGALLEISTTNPKPLILSTSNYNKSEKQQLPGTSWPHYNLCPHIVRPVQSTRILWLLRTMIM